MAVMTTPPAITEPGWQVLAAPGRGPAAASATPASPRRILIEVLISITVVVVAVAAIGLYLSRRIAEREAVHDVAQLTDVLAEGVVQPALTDAMATSATLASAKLDTIIRSGILNTSVVRVKLWTPAGVVLYSDESRLVGQQFTLDDEAESALTAPRTEAGVTNLDRPENALETIPGKLLEVYRPVWTPSGKPLLFEAYFRYDVVTDRSRDLYRGFSGLMLSSLLAVLLLLLPLLWTFYGRARSAQAQRENLMRRALDSSTEERRRIAATLHDGVVQQLAGASFLVAGEAAEATARGETQVAGRLTGAADIVRDGVSGMRSLLVDIYPPSLQSGGLEAALFDLTRTLPVPVDLRVDANTAAALTPEQVQAVFRVAQECLRNAVKHARASRIVLSLTTESRSAVLEVADDGAGFDLVAARLITDEGHFGLRLMADVADEIGAGLAVDTGADGTTFRLEVPFS